MRQIALVLAAAAATLVAAEAKQEQISLLDTHDKTTGEQNTVQGWWDRLSSASSLFSGIEDRITRTIRHSSLDSILALVDDNDDDDGDDDDELDIDGGEHGGRPWPPRRRHGRHGRGGRHGDPDKTIYELIKESNHTTKFAKLVDEHDEIKQLLQDTKHNHTLFVPTDRAFKRIPHGRHGRHGGDGDDKDDDDDDDHHKPPKEFILALLKYHLTPGLYPVHRIRASQTLPSELHRPALDSSSSSSSSSFSSNHHDDHDESNPQRIRASTTPLLHRTRLNFVSRLVAGDFVASNGLIHAIDYLLIPPPNSTTILRLFPAQFSTLSLALETTGLAEELASIPRAGGGTVFAPSNAAWAKLGARVNGFLFSERGKKYLKALVKYHVAVNETLYSDKYYRGHRDGEQHEEEEKDEDEMMKGGRQGSDFWHVDLTSLLDGKPISVVGKRWKGFVSLVVNGAVKVVVRDGVADDGVIHIVDRVLIPPHRHPGGHGLDDEDEVEIPLEEFKSRLSPYLETEESGRRESFGDL